MPIELKTSDVTTPQLVDQIEAILHLVTALGYDASILTVADAFTIKHKLLDILPTLDSYKPGEEFTLQDALDHHKGIRVDEEYLERKGYNIAKGIIE